VAIILQKPANIVITSHHNPDGDALGSSMAMFHILKQLNHNIKVIIPNDYPDFLRWIPENESLIVFESDKKEIAEQAFSESDLVFCCDFNALNRVGKMEKALTEAKGIKLLIDHHPNPDEKAFNFLFSTTAASSTAELVYEFAQNTGLMDFINKEAAECLYAGIITDTGSFSFASNSPQPYLIVADLIKRGINTERLHRLIYDTFSENRIRLLGFAINQKMLILNEFHTALIPLTRKELESFEHKIGDTEGIVNFPLSIKNINLSVMLSEREDLIRLSFRSKGKFPANQIAREYFEGGGHINAAGGNSYVSMEETIQKIINILPLFKADLDFIIS